MAELADAMDLGSIGQHRAGSNPVTRTKKKTLLYEGSSLNDRRASEKMSFSFYHVMV